MIRRALIFCSVVWSCGIWSDGALARKDNLLHADFTKEQSMSEDADPSRYHLTFRSTMDRMGKDPELFAYLNVLRVEGATGQAMMLLNRQGGDLPGTPIGVFSTTLKKEQVLALGVAIEGVKWNETGSFNGGDIHAANLSLDYSRGTRIIQRDFNAMNGQMLNAISAIMSQITEMMRLLEDHPSRAIDVAVARTASGLKLVIRNIGTGSVVIADPRHPGSEMPPTCGWVGVAREVPEVHGVFRSPIPLQPIPLPSLGIAPPWVTIAPGKSIDVETVAWTPSGAGKYFARGNWKDYSPIAGDPKAFLPLVPDPRDIEHDERPYRIRGAAFSSVLRFTAR
jgi:hypothetical protein